jgi:ribonuclease T2
MQQYWKDYQGDDQGLWSHEWSKHGTCMSTLDTSCYADYQAQEEVVDYFDATVALFKTLPTYETLAAASILPSSSRTWTEEEIQAPLKKMHGATVTLGCKDKIFNEVWYHFSVRGPVQTGEFVATEPDRAKSSCPGTGIRYLPKGPSESSSSTTEPTKSQSDAPVPTATSTAAPFTGKGFLDVYVKGKVSPQGCLISGGRWYASGTCASFRTQEDILEQSAATMDDQDEPYMFTLISSKGPCGIIDDQFHCAEKLPAQTIFSKTGNATLTYQKHTSFYADGIPRNFEKGNISTVKQTGEAAVELEIVWSSISSRTQAHEGL